MSEQVADKATLVRALAASLTRGNFVVYMRLKGHVPPSTADVRQPGK